MVKPRAAIWARRKLRCLPHKGGCAPPMTVDTRPCACISAHPQVTGLRVLIGVGGSRKGQPVSRSGKGQRPSQARQGRIWKEISRDQTHVCQV